MARRPGKRALTEAFEAGVLAGRLQYKAKRATHRSRPKPRTFMQWLRKHALELGLLGSALGAVANGAWTMFTYFNPAPPAVVQPFDSGQRNRPSSEVNDNAPEPRERSMDPLTPKIELLIYGVPVGNVPQPVQRSLQAAAAIIERTPEQQRQVEADLLTLLANLGYLGKNVSNVVVWKDWHTIAVVPVAQDTTQVRPAVLTLDPSASPKTFKPEPPKPSSNRQV